MSSSTHFYCNSFGDFERLFDGAFSPRSRSFCTTKLQGPSSHVTPQSVLFRPRMDVKESKDSIVVTATFELPGPKSKDIAVDLQKDRLTISGEFTGVEADGYMVRERRSGRFSRTLQLPFGTKPEDVNAKLDDGLLTVTFPKSSPEEVPQRISIQ